MAVHIIQVKIRNNKTKITPYVNNFISTANRLCEGLELFKDNMQDVTYDNPGVFNINTNTGLQLYYIVLKDKNKDYVIDTDEFLNRFTSAIEALKSTPCLTRIETITLNTLLNDKCLRLARSTEKCRIRYRKIDVASDKKIVRLWRSPISCRLLHRVIGSDRYNKKPDYRDEDISIFNKFQFVAKLSHMIMDNYIMIYKYSKHSRVPIVYICLEEKYRDRLNSILESHNAIYFYEQFMVENKYTYHKLSDIEIEEMLKCKLRIF